MKKIIKKIILFSAIIIAISSAFGQKAVTTKDLILKISFFEIIKLDAPPAIFPEWEVYKNSQETGYLKINPENFQLFPTEKEIKKIKEIEKMLMERQEVEKIIPSNSNLLDFLLANPHKIPAGWKEEKIFFTGTIFQDKEGYLIVRYLFFDKDNWNWGWSYYEEDDYLLGKILLIKQAS